ncbi:hypothetical protein DM02DRAFT_535207 [Periconia macrospinosa]|uniref:Transcription factor domain-containing protein n=1 Tax=Periconia macrospinosa TaxID=97972 RepID=A0A2V1DEL5_9PLEO|nr:hypothetical protein DM02DRAFT_535207 [Periconia macrospinosa]
MPALSLPNFMGGIGELQRIEGSTDSWQWVIGELKRCPRDLAMNGETLFLHSQLYREVMPAVIRTAMGICAMYCIQNANNRDTTLRMIDDAVLELINSPSPMMTDASGEIHPESGLLDELARLQAFALYQMIRMFSGGIEQRVTIDLQRGLLTTRALQLLRRSRIVLGDNLSPIQNWNAWIVAESIRRTVLVIYMFYGMYSMAMHGVCVDFATLAKLPVSTSPASWQVQDARAVFGAGTETERTLPYEDYTQEWMVSTQKTLHPFEKFLIVPCKGLEGVRAFGFEEV